MAELLECLLCGYKTVRCGMTNHLKSKHPLHYAHVMLKKKDPIVSFTKSLGKVTGWSKNRNQMPKVKA